MAIVREYGKPHIFLTFTATGQWDDIKNNLYPGETSYDRPDLVCRVFHHKLKMLMNDLLKDHKLGKVNSFLYTVEFQKRG